MFTLRVDFEKLNNVLDSFRLTSRRAKTKEWENRVSKVKWEENCVYIVELIPSDKGWLREKENVWIEEEVFLFIFT